MKKKKVAFHNTKEHCGDGDVWLLKASFSLLLILFFLFGFFFFLVAFLFLWTVFAAIYFSPFRYRKTILILILSRTLLVLRLGARLVAVLCWCCRILWIGAQLYTVIFLRVTLRMVLNNIN